MPEEIKSARTHIKMAKADVNTLVAITGQAEDDVISVLKQYGGDLEAATNALLDSECLQEPRVDGSARPSVPTRARGKNTTSRKKLGHSSGNTCAIARATLMRPEPSFR